MRFRLGDAATPRWWALLPLLLVLSGAASAAITCPKDFKKSPVGDKCFHLSPLAYTFEACQRDVCGPQGAALACMHSQEQAWMGWNFGRNEEELTAAWIGYFKGGKGKDWSWVNGCHNNNFTNWMPGNPDDSCGGEDCTAFAGVQGGWLDVSCRLRLQCLCEFPGKSTAAFERSVPALRDDTCYADCGDLTKWCSTWPFMRLYDANDDVCHWEAKDGQRRGRGVSECEKRARRTPGCGKYFSYSVGRCRCSPRTGPHLNCTAREAMADSDIFLIEATGARLVSHGQRCIYTTIVDDAFFSTLRPATTGSEIFVIWFKAASIWIIFGVPCLIVMFVVTWHMCFCCGTGSTSSWPRPVAGGADGSYGRLFDSAEEGTNEAVNSWIFRGAVGAILYGLGLLALGGTLAAHMAGAQTGFVAELFEALCMAASMAAVARAAFMVHFRLAPWAKDVVGPWILVLTLAKVGLALSALCGVLIFSTLADKDYENVCFAEYAFRWAMLLALPLTCTAGFALSRVQANAEAYAGSDMRVGGWVFLLILGNFVAGSSVWWAGYLDSVHEAYIGVAAFFVFAAVGQLLEGVSLMVANRKVKLYFAGQAGCGAEMAPPSTIGHAMPPLPKDSVTEF